MPHLITAKHTPIWNSFSVSTRNESTFDGLQFRRWQYGSTIIHVIQDHWSWCQSIECAYATSY